MTAPTKHFADNTVEHLVRQVLCCPDDCTVFKTLEEKGVLDMDLHSLYVFALTEWDADLDATYTSDDGEVCLLEQGYRELLRAFFTYFTLTYDGHLIQSMYRDHDLSLSTEDFKLFSTGYGICLPNGDFLSESTDLSACYDAPAPATDGETHPSTPLMKTVPTAKDCEQMQYMYEHTGSDKSNGMGSDATAF